MPGFAHEVESRAQALEMAPQAQTARLQIGKTPTMRKQLVAATLTALLAAMPLTACSNESNQNDPVQAALDAMDSLGIQHTDPERASSELSGAKEHYDITINNTDAGINVFPDEETRNTWLELSDSFGGVAVVYGNSVISLNSDDGIQDSIQIAPKLADKLGGEAHGIGHTND